MAFWHTRSRSRPRLTVHGWILMHRQPKETVIGDNRQFTLSDLADLPLWLAWRLEPDQNAIRQRCRPEYRATGAAAATIRRAEERDTRPQRARRILIGRWILAASGAGARGRWQADPRGHPTWTCAAVRPPVMSRLRRAPSSSASARIRRSHRR